MSNMSEVMDIISTDNQELRDLEFLPMDILGQSTSELPTELEELDTTPSGIQEKSRSIRAAFLAARSLDEVYMQAKGMHFITWLDYFIKMMPKEVQVKGSFDIRQMIAQLGPIQRKGAA